MNSALAYALMLAFFVGIPSVDAARLDCSFEKLIEIVQKQKRVQSDTATLTNPQFIEKAWGRMVEEGLVEDGAERAFQEAKQTLAPLLQRGLLVRAIADELSLRGITQRADVREAIDLFSELFSPQEQIEFVDGIIDRILPSVKASASAENFPQVRKDARKLGIDTRTYLALQREWKHLEDDDYAQLKFAVLMTLYSNESAPRISKLREFFRAALPAVRLAPTDRGMKRILKRFFLAGPHDLAPSSLANDVARIKPKSKIAITEKRIPTPSRLPPLVLGQVRYFSADALNFIKNAPEERVRRFISTNIERFSWNELIALKNMEESSTKVRTPNDGVGARLKQLQRYGELKERVQNDQLKLVAEQENFRALSNMKDMLEDFAKGEVSWTIDDVQKFLAQLSLADSADQVLDLLRTLPTDMEVAELQKIIGAVDDKIIKFPSRATELKEMLVLRAGAVRGERSGAYIIDDVRKHLQRRAPRITVLGNWMTFSIPRLAAEASSGWVTSNEEIKTIQGHLVETRRVLAELEAQLMGEELVESTIAPAETIDTVDKGSSDHDVLSENLNSAKRLDTLGGDSSSDRFEIRD